jgi:hypothetical protein
MRRPSEGPAEELPAGGIEQGASWVRTLHQQARRRKKCPFRRLLMCSTACAGNAGLLFANDQRQTDEAANRGGLMPNQGWKSQLDCKDPATGFSMWEATQTMSSPYAAIKARLSASKAIAL